MAPLATVTSKWVTRPAGGPVPVTFSEPVARVAYAGHTARGTGTSLKLPEQAKAGTVKVAVAARPWEKLGDPATVHYFPPAKRPVALVSPAPGGRLDPGDQVRLVFSQPPGGTLPKASLAGHWRASGRPHARLHRLRRRADARHAREDHAAPHRRAGRHERARDQDRPRAQLDRSAGVAHAADPAPGRGGLPAGASSTGAPSRTPFARSPPPPRTRPTATSAGATRTRRPSSSGSSSPRRAT